MKTEKIMDGNLILAIIIRDTDWEEGLNFISSNEDYLQVGIWGYDKRKILESHIHLVKPRKVLRTQEVLFIKKGGIWADIYTEQEKFLKSVELREGDTIILLNGGHGYKILENNTKVLEIKNGPYLGVEKDRKRFKT